MKTIRTFLAIPLSPPVAQAATSLVKRVKKSGAGNDTSEWDSLKWVPLENLHLTLKFLGEVDNIETPRVCNVVEEVCADYDPFELLFQGASALPSVSKARVLTIAVDDPTGALCEIVAKLEDRFADLGFRREPRDYQPHLTLARAKSSQRRIAEPLVEEWLSLGGALACEMIADGVEVIGSFLEKRGPTYNVMHTVDL